MLRAQVGNELHFQALAIDVAGKIKDVAFQKRVAQAGGRRAAEIGDPVPPRLLALDPDPDDIDAVLGMDQFAELDIGGGEAQLAAVLLAGFNNAVCDPGAAQHFGGEFRLARH